MQMDALNTALLLELQRDSRQSNGDLAARLGLSASALWRRVRALEEAGVITHYGAVVDPARMGLGFRAIVHVHLTRHDRDQLAAFLHAIEHCPQVQDCYATTGQADYHLHVLCADLDAYNRFLEDVLFASPAVASAQTNVVLRAIKTGAPVGG